MTMMTLQKKFGPRKPYFWEKPFTPLRRAAYVVGFALASQVVAGVIPCGDVKSSAYDQANSTDIITANEWGNFGLPPERKSELENVSVIYLGNRSYVRAQYSVGDDAMRFVTLRARETRSGTPLAIQPGNLVDVLSQVAPLAYGLDVDKDGCISLSEIVVDEGRDGLGNATLRFPEAYVSPVSKFARAPL